MSITASLLSELKQNHGGYTLYASKLIWEKCPGHFSKFPCMVFKEGDNWSIYLFGFVGR